MGLSGLTQAIQCRRPGDDRPVAEVGGGLVGAQGAGLPDEPARRDRNVANRGVQVDVRDRGVDAVHVEYGLHELAKLHGFLIGDEVGLARLTVPPTQEQTLDDVVDVGDIGRVVAPVDPREPARLRKGGEDIGDGASGTPDELGADGHRGETVRVRIQHQRLLLRLDCAIRRRRVRSQGRSLIDIDERVAGQQRSLAATVHEAGNLGVAGDLQCRPCPLDGHQLMPGEVGVQIGLGRQVEQHLAARHAVAPRLRLGEHPLHRRRAQSRDRIC